MTACACKTCGCHVVEGSANDGHNGQCRRCRTDDEQFEENQKTQWTTNKLLTELLTEIKQLRQELKRNEKMAS